MTLQMTEPTSGLAKWRGVFLALAAALGVGVVCAVLRAPYPVVVVGGLAVAALGFWLERAVLISPETAQRKDFYLILVAGYGFFAVVGVGLVALACLLTKWCLPHL
jgi:hypothetical protein